MPRRDERCKFLRYAGTKRCLRYVVKRDYCSEHFAEVYPQQPCYSFCKASECSSSHNRLRRAVRRGFCARHFAEMFPSEDAPRLGARACYVCGPSKSSQRRDQETGHYFCKPCFKLHAAKELFCYYCFQVSADIHVSICGSDEVDCVNTVQLCDRCCTVGARTLCMPCFHKSWAEKC